MRGCSLIASRLKPELERIAYRTLLVSDSLPWPNPCIDLKSRYSSPNCSYPLTIKGPELDCTDISAEETHVLSGSKDPYNTTLFEAGFPSLTDDSFHIGWYPESQVSCEDKDKRFCEVISKDEPKFLSCSAALAEYSVQVTFNDTMRILDFPPPKAGEMIPGHVSLYRNFNPSESAPPERDLPSSYQLVQALAIRDALFRSLEGRLSFGSSVFSEERTHILQSRFSNGGTISELNNITTLRLDITKNRLQDFMHDITFSLVHLARPHWENDTDVIEMKYVNKYEFNSKPNIYVPYGLSLAATFAILILGLISLRSNGAPADDGFLQIVCSTRASKVLDEAAKRVCRGEDAHAAVELTGLELVFGDIEQKDNGHRGQGDEALEEVEEHASVLTGFGTLDEVRSMKRRI